MSVQGFDRTGLGCMRLVGKPGRTAVLELDLCTPLDRPVAGEHCTGLAVGAIVAFDIGLGNWTGHIAVLVQAERVVLG
jgi:hypothetical protein